MKIQTLVLKKMWEDGREMSVGEIAKEANLRITQAHIALTRLKQRGLINKRIINKNRYTGHKNPPRKELRVKLNERMMNKIKRVIGRK